MSGLRAGAAYFGLIFAAGFALGTLRVTVLAPALGETGAVAVEIPVMLALSWLAAGFLIRRIGVARGAPRALMGATGFALLIAAEVLVVGMALSGLTLATIAERWTSPSGALGLAAQIGFAAIPLLHPARG